MSCQPSDLGPDEIRFFQGEDAAYLIEVLDENRDAANLSGTILALSVVRTLGGTPVITKSSAVSGEIDILFPESEGRAKAYFVPADTLGLSPGDYFYDVWATLMSGKVITVVRPSRFTILQPAAPP